MSDESTRKACLQPTATGTCSRHERKRSRVDVQLYSPAAIVASKLPLALSLIIWMAVLTLPTADAFGVSSLMRSPSVFFGTTQRQAAKPSLSKSSLLATGGSSSLTIKRPLAQPRPNKKKELTSPKPLATSKTDRMTLLMNHNMTTTKMVGMSAFGAAFSLGIVFTLAVSDGPGTLLPAGSLPSEWMGIADNVIDAALPLSASDVVTVALGEGVSGVLGSAALFGLRSVISWRQKVDRTLQKGARKGARSISAQALADGDFFVARAAALPLLEALGLSPVLATVASVFFATVPYEIVKLGSRRREQLQDENEQLQQMLDEKMEKDKTRNGLFNILQSMSSLQGRQYGSKSTTNKASVDLNTLMPVQDIKSKGVDLVEVFSDITKWLEYDVLKSDFGGRLSWDEYPLPPGIEGALFGSLASLSAQLYADILYANFCFGPKEIQELVKGRTVSEWFKVYLSRIVVGATLFGVYDGVQIPATSIIAAFLSGGIVNCAESQDYNMCIEVFLAGNPPEEATASVAAQLRALATALDSLVSRYTPFNTF